MGLDRAEVTAELAALIRTVLAEAEEKEIADGSILRISARLGHGVDEFLDPSAKIITDNQHVPNGPDEIFHDYKLEAREPRNKFNPSGLEKSATEMVKALVEAALEQQDRAHDR